MKSKPSNLVVIIITAFVFFSACNNNGEKTATPGKVNVSTELIRLQKAITARPDSAGLRYLLMDELLKNKLYKEALAENDTLMRADTANAVLWYRRGAILLQEGDTVKGVRALQTAMKHGPLFMEPQLQLAAIYADQSNGEAITITDNIIRYSQEPVSTTSARFIQGLYYSNINDKAKALQRFNDCIKNDYTFLDAYVEKGLLLYDQKNFADALKVFEQTIQVSNSFTEGYYNAGRCEEALGNKTEAINYYKKTIGLDKAFTAAHEGLKRLGA